MTNLFANAIFWTVFLFLAGLFYVVSIKIHVKEGEMSTSLSRFIDRKVVIVLFCFAFVVFTLFSYYRTPTVDVNWYMSWARALNKFGYGNFYGNPEAMEEVFLGIANYPPSYMYVLSICDLVVRVSPFDYVNNPRVCGLIYKIPGILTHLAAGYCVYRLANHCQTKKFALLSTIVFLFSPHILYNTAVWGQTDEMFAVLSVISLYGLSKNKPIPACILLGFLIAFKPQVIFFAPVYFCWALFGDRKRRKYLIIGPAVAVVTAVAVSFPFLRTLNPMALAEFYMQPHGGGLTVYAANVYGLFLHSIRVSQTAYTVLLYAMYALCVAIAGLVYYKLRHRDETQRIMLTTAVSATICFMVLPAMHERYLFLAVFPLFVVFIIKKCRFLLQAYLLLGLCSFLNMFVVLNGSLFGKVGFSNQTWMTAFMSITMLTLCVCIWILYRTIRNRANTHL